MRVEIQQYITDVVLEWDMALMFGVSARTIRHIMHYEIWKDLPDKPAE